MINLFIHLFNKNGPSAYNGPGTILSVWDTSVNKGDSDSCPWGAYILVGGDKISQFNSQLEDGICRVGVLGLSRARGEGGCNLKLAGRVASMKR